MQRSLHNVAQPTWLSCAVQCKLKKVLKMHFCVFSHFLAHVGKPDSHIGWATLMAFTSIYPNNPSTNLWNFQEKHGELRELKISVFLSRQFHTNESQSTFIGYGKDGSKFWWLPWFSEKSGGGATELWNTLYYIPRDCYLNFFFANPHSFEGKHIFESISKMIKAFRPSRLKYDFFFYSSARRSTWSILGRH